MNCTTLGLVCNSWRSWLQILVLMWRFLSPAYLPGVQDGANGSNLVSFRTIFGYLCLNLGLQFPRPVRTARMPDWQLIAGVVWKPTRHGESFGMILSRPCYRNICSWGC